MRKKAIFTICAKNYLAQALTLRESIFIHNKDVDFFIFLSDKKTDDVEDIDLVELDNNWMPNWKSLAFKYNVIEFSTSIKPFCFYKLFKEGYDKVIYLDPDIYVVNPLNEIFDYLDKYAMVITPHYNHIETNYTGSVPEEELLFVGIYNLGFGAIRKCDIGLQILEWWKNRLYDKCYADKEDSLHVDQKWIDFLPGFFPNDILISHHPGINIAIWNLHERELIIEDNKYLVLDLRSNLKYPLLFFHFSGFDPYKRNVVNRRHSRFNTDVFPSYIPIIDVYAKLEYKNGYDKYSKLKYSFNKFDNGASILPLHRRLYRSYNNTKMDDVFSESSVFYKLLKRNRLILQIENQDYNLGISQNVRSKVNKVDNIFNFLSRLFIFFLGIKRYYFLLKYLHSKTRLENQYFLLGKTDNRL